MTVQIRTGVKVAKQEGLVYCRNAEARTFKDSTNNDFKDFLAKALKDFAEGKINSILIALVDEPIAGSVAS